MARDRFLSWFGSYRSVSAGQQSAQPLNVEIFLPYPQIDVQYRPDRSAERDAQESDDLLGVVGRIPFTQSAKPRQYEIQNEADDPEHDDRDEDHGQPRTEQSPTFPGDQAPGPSEALHRPDPLDHSERE